MREGIHPVYSDMIFKDVSSDFAILTRSTLSSKEMMKWTDGKEYPMLKMDISSASHPFYTGTNILIDTAGRIEKFNRRYNKK